MSSFDEQCMREAIRLSLENVAQGGGPFGAVIAKDGKIIATGTNGVTRDNDPTAHAEITAIRAAAQKLGTFDLSGCVIYTSCEPCPMCLAAIYWARLGEVFFGNNQHDARAVGFDDNFIYQQFALPAAQRKIPMRPLLRPLAQSAFAAWAKAANKTYY